MGLFALTLAGAVVGLSASGSTFTPPAMPYNLSEVRCLALTIYFEARGESEIGKRAVGHVVMNRVGSPGFPDSICGVVWQGGDAVRHRCQFSWYCDGRSDRPKDRADWKRSLVVAEDILAGRSADPTHGALWFHHKGVAPPWRKGLRARLIGAHYFYRGPLKANPA
jgi:spore germination cell wall hydrolase CwlJ-like protein